MWRSSLPGRQLAVTHDISRRALLVRHHGRPLLSVVSHGPVRPRSARERRSPVQPLDTGQAGLAQSRYDGRIATERREFVFSSSPPLPLSIYHTIMGVIKIPCRNRHGAASRRGRAALRLAGLRTRPRTSSRATGSGRQKEYCLQADPPEAGGSPVHNARQWLGRAARRRQPHGAASGRHEPRPRPWTARRAASRPDAAGLGGAIRCASSRNGNGGRGVEQGRSG